MDLKLLRNFDLVYLATPYSRYPEGIHRAFERASEIAADLLRLGVNVYAPIVHTHPIAIYGHIDPLDHDIWLPFDAAMMGKADAMIVAMMDGWQTSKGIAHEVKVFQSAGKPVFYVGTADLRAAVEQSVAAFQWPGDET
ncbi:MAG: hypothetical protein NVS3B5_02220 [Sphingomicrobium sp.]